MARPAPDPRQVMAIFEAMHFGGLSYGELVEWTRGARTEKWSESWEWDPISRGTAHAWFKAGLAWYIEHERLSPDEHKASLEIGYRFAGTELLSAYRRGEIDVEKFVKLTVILGARVEALAGVGSGFSDPVAVVTVTDRAVAAIEEMKARREERDRGRPRRGIA